MDDIVRMKLHNYPRRKRVVSTAPVCLQVFWAANDHPNGDDMPFRCGLPEGHDGAHAWRGDLPGGPVED